MTQTALAGVDARDEGDEGDEGDENEHGAGGERAGDAGKHASVHAWALVRVMEPCIRPIVVAWVPLHGLGAVHGVALEVVPDDPAVRVPTVRTAKTARLREHLERARPIRCTPRSGAA